MDLGQFYGNVSGWVDDIWRDDKDDGAKFDDLADDGLN